MKFESGKHNYWMFCICFSVWLDQICLDFEFAKWYLNISFERKIK